MSPALLKNYYAVITDCWGLLKKFSDPIDNPEFWTALTEEANELYTRHGKVNFSDRMISVVMQEIENIYKEQSDGNS